MAKARPGHLNFSSAGVGSGTHFAAELFKSMAAVDVVHVPFKGIPEALTETVTGRVQFFMAPIANAVNLMKDGRLLALGRVLAAARRARARGADDRRGGRARLRLDPVVRAPHLEQDAAAGDREAEPRDRAHLRDPDAKTRWAPIGLDPRPTTPEEFDRLIADDMATFTRLARAGNIKAD